MHPLPDATSDGSDSSDEIAAAHAKPIDLDTGADDDEDDDEDDENDIDDDETYEVEAILGHRTVKGNIVYTVKWKGYGNEDNTEEPEENIIDGAMTLLKSYWDSIGGKPEPETKGKRKRQSASASAAPESSGRGRGRKRSRVDGESATPDAHQVIRGKPKWEIPKGSWEKVISSIDTLEEVRNPQDGKNQVFGLVVWENGQKSKYSLNTLKQKCPQKLISYFEQHLVFRQNGPDENDESHANGDHRVDEGAVLQGQEV